LRKRAEKLEIIGMEKCGKRKEGGAMEKERRKRKRKECKRQIL
jgi:hypothetical protein